MTLSPGEEGFQCSSVGAAVGMAVEYFGRIHVHGWLEAEENVMEGSLGRNGVML